MSVIRAGLRAVNARRSTADLHEKYAAKEPEVMMSNERHRFFIDVLEEVLENLEPHVNAEPRASDSSSSSCITRLVNSFGVLDVEEPLEGSEEPLHKQNMPQAATQAKATTASPNYKVEETRLEKISNALFAVHCLLDEYLSLRAFTRLSWNDYKNGSYDLPTVAVAINTAFELAKKNHEEIMGDFPDFLDGPDGMIKVFQFFHELDKCTPESEKQAFYGSAGPPLNYATTSLVKPEIVDTRSTEEAADGSAAESSDESVDRAVDEFDSESGNRSGDDADESDDESDNGFDNESSDKSGNRFRDWYIHCSSLQCA